MLKRELLDLRTKILKLKDKRMKGLDFARKFALKLEIDMDNFETISGLSLAKLSFIAEWIRKMNGKQNSKSDGSFDDELDFLLNSSQEY